MNRYRIVAFIEVCLCVVVAVAIGINESNSWILLLIPVFMIGVISYEALERWLMEHSIIFKGVY